MKDPTAAAAQSGTKKGGAKALIGAGALLVLVAVGAAVFLQGPEPPAATDGADEAAGTAGTASATDDPAGTEAPAADGGETAKTADKGDKAADGGGKAGDAKEEGGFILPSAEHVADAPDDVYEVKLTEESVQAEDMDDVDVEDGVPEDAEGEPATVKAIRDAVKGKSAVLLADAGLPFSLVSPVMFSLGAMGDKVALAAKEASGEGKDEDEFGLVHVVLDAGADKSAAPPLKIKVKVKAKLGGGYKKLKKDAKAKAAEAVETVTECVRKHVKGKAKGKFKMSFAYDETGKRTGSKIKDSFDGDEPTPCIVGVFESWDFGEPKGGKAGKLKVAVSFKASPPKAKKSAPPPPEVVVVIDDEGFTVAVPDQEPFSVPKAGDDYNARGLAARLVASKDKLPAGVRARIKADGGTPYKAVVAVASALAAEVEGSKLFTTVVISPAAAD